MQVNDLLHHTSEWLRGTGPNSDIVISSRIRLARNLDDVPFPHWANKKQGEEVLKRVENAKSVIDSLGTATLFKLAEMDGVDKQFLVERHLMSLEQAQRKNSKVCY